MSRIKKKKYTERHRANVKLMHITAEQQGLYMDQTKAEFSFT